MASHRIPFESLSAAERSRLMADNDRLRQQLRDRHRLADLAGNSRAIRRVCDLIAQVAPSAHSVCLTGEEGVGKTRAARAIHAASPRSAGPFIAVTCSSMLEADVDAQLFGFDARPRTAPTCGGCAGRAEGGTLFFDDVGRPGSARAAQAAQAGARAHVGAARRRAHAGGRARDSRDDSRPEAGGRGRAIAEISGSTLVRSRFTCRRFANEKPTCRF